MQARRPLIAAIVLMAALLVALPLGGVALSGDQRVFETDLTGAEEAPGPGDPDATGSALIKLPRATGNGPLCFKLDWAGIDGTVTAAHIHSGVTGVPGPVVIPLFVGQSLPGTGDSHGCVQGVDPALTMDIGQNPTNYYVNVHSSLFQPGAVRGQLGD